VEGYLSFFYFQAGMNFYLFICPIPVLVGMYTCRYWAKVEVGQTLEATLLILSNIPLPGYGWICFLLLGPLENHKQYEVTMSDYLACNCVDFVSMMALSLGKWGFWVSCKHLYYILQYAMYFGIRESFVHYPLRVGMRFIDYYIETKS
jgi:hypothetical protein